MYQISKSSGKFTGPVRYLWEVMNRTLNIEIGSHWKAKGLIEQNISSAALKESYPKICVDMYSLKHLG